MTNVAQLTRDYRNLGRTQNMETRVEGNYTRYSLILSYRRPVC